CSRCRGRFYCGRDCQAADWKTHKLSCGRQVYDKHRKCRDGNLHEGNLELITWPSAKEETGWGHCFTDESDSLREKFENEFGGTRKNYTTTSASVRWTCCGRMLDGLGMYHHGTGSKPCSCDFCKMGKPLPDSIYREQSASRHGLVLRRGPDPRSFNRASAIGVATGRTSLGCRCEGIIR
ncbi:hypothetical protein BDZ97DRAFT_1656541, partial [Flammula alnicola]